MATVNFVVRSEKKGKMANLLARFAVGSSLSFYTKSGFMVLSDTWNNKSQRFKSRFIETDQFSEENARQIQNQLNDLRALILNALNNLEKEPSKEWLEEIIHNFHNPTVSIEKSKMTLSKYIENFVAEMESGDRLNINKRRYTPSTIKNYKGFIVQFSEFSKAKRKKYDFADINMDLYDDFVAYFTKKNYSINTIGRHVKELKIIMRAARDEGFHNNNEIERKKFRVVTAKVDNIYLNETELRAMAALDLSKRPNLVAARDVFLVGCYTAQRYGDYSTINETNIRKLENGDTVLDLKQQKTGSRVVVPLRPEVLEILERYGNALPKTHEQKVNKYIKEVAEMAGIVEPVEVEEMNDGFVVKHSVRKCELVKTHTARRSGATNMYLAGIPTIAIMKVTGHKTEKEFMKYIKISEEETAMELFSHPYFSGKK